MGKKSAFKSKVFRVGTFSTAVSLIAIVLAIVLNLIVNRLPSTVTRFDTTATKIFTLSEQTTEILKNLDEDVHIYLVAQTGSEDSNLTELLARYSALSGHVKVENKDPILYSNFLDDFSATIADTTAINNSIVVESAKRKQLIMSSDIYISSTDPITGEATSTFNGERYLTSAIDYVITDDLPKVYALSGHGEDILSDSMQRSVALENLTLQKLDLLAHGRVPEDAACVYIANPSKDLTDEEYEYVFEYLEKGGRLMLVTKFTGLELTNLEKLMESYGVRETNGFIIEGDGNYCLTGYPHYLRPTFMVNDITDPLIDGGLRVIMPRAHGIEPLENYRSTLEINPLVVTSDDAYSKVDGFEYTTAEKEPKDIAGPFNLGVAITEKYSDIETRIVWLSSSEMLDPTNDTLSAGANTNLFLNCLDWMCQRESSVSVRSKTTNVQMLSMSASDARMWTMVFVIIIPIAIIATGTVVFIRRKKH